MNSPPNGRVRLSYMRTPRPRPFGYRQQPETPVFRGRDDGERSLRAIAADLNAPGVLTRRGGKWHVSTVKNLLAKIARGEKRRENRIATDSDCRSLTVPAVRRLVNGSCG